MKLFDSHAHLNFKGLKEDIDSIVRKSFENGMEGIINVGSRYDNSLLAVEQAQKYEKVYASIGFHPDHLKELKKEDIETEIEKFKALSSDPKVVAIGEIGFDNYYYKTGVNKDTKENHDKEKLIFKAFMELAVETDLPVIIHSRDAEEETLKIIAQYSKKLKKNGVVHCFTGSVKFAEGILDLGFYIGFTGIITYPKTDDLKEVVRRVPMDKMLIETDAPFLAPQAYRGKRNEPLYVEEVAKEIAKIKGLAMEEVVDETTKNAKKLFY